MTGHRLKEETVKEMRIHALWSLNGFLSMDEDERQAFDDRHRYTELRRQLGGPFIGRREWMADEALCDQKTRLLDTFLQVCQAVMSTKATVRLTDSKLTPLHLFGFFRRGLSRGEYIYGRYIL